MDQDITGMLWRLNYDSSWIEAGILGIEALQAQFTQIETPGADQNTEHYRCWALVTYIHELKELSDAELEVLLGVADRDPVLRSNFHHELLIRRFLTDSQFDRVSAALGDRPIVKRLRLLRCLERDSTSLELIQECLEHGDGEVHGALLRLPLISVEVVEQVHERGANRRVRNIAGQLLKQRRFKP